MAYAVEYNALNPKDKKEKPDYEGMMIGLNEDALALQAEALAFSYDIANRMTEIAEEDAERARQQWDTYTTHYLPGEIEFIRSSFAGIPIDLETGWASAGVKASFDKAGETQRRNLARMGIDPTSGAFAQSEEDMAIARAAAEAGARNDARRVVRDTNYERERQAVSIGRGIPQTASGISSQAASAYGAAGAGVNSAAGNASQTSVGIGQNYASMYQSDQNRKAAEDQADADELSGLFGGLGAIGGSLPFCWVAREVYGESNPKWLQFRAWLLKDAPAWFCELYRQCGAGFARWIANKPALKSCIRAWMDRRIEEKGV